jgi:hypothetical protein
LAQAFPAHGVCVAAYVRFRQRGASLTPPTSWPLHSTSGDRMDGERPIVSVVALVVGGAIAHHAMNLRAASKSTRAPVTSSRLSDVAPGAV